MQHLTYMTEYEMTESGWSEADILDRIEDQEIRHWLYSVSLLFKED